MNFLQTEIKRLEDERIRLTADKSYNETQIEQYNRLIDYYCTLYNEILSSINSNRDVLEIYGAILDFKNKVQFPSWIENISLLSDEHLNHMITKMEKLISKLTRRSDELKENILDCQKAKRYLIMQNEELSQEIGLIDSSFENEDVSLYESVSNDGKQMVKERVRG